MKLIKLLPFVGLLTTFNVWADAINLDGSVNLNSCSAVTNSCTINDKGIKITISCPYDDRLYFYDNNTTLGCNNHYKSLVITSNTPFTVGGAGGTIVKKDMMNVTINDTGGTEYAKVASIKFMFGVQDGLIQSLQAVDSILYSSYVNALNASNMFQGNIAKTHRGHMTRFMQALQDGISLLDPNNKDKVAIVDWRVQENARLIVVFGTIMNELLMDYDDVENLKVAIQSLNSLVNQLRTSYGWEKGLAGTASKASAALLNVLRLEIQELASIKMAMGESNLEAYTNLLRTSGVLLAKVNASKSGDMKAQREIYDLVDAWNSPAFQTELKKLVNAGPDFKNLVLPKLVMLIKTVESINELTDAGMNLPDQSQTTKVIK